MINFFQPTFQQQWYGILKASNFIKYRIWHRIIATTIALLIIFFHQAHQLANIVTATTINQTAPSTCTNMHTTVEFGYCTDKLDSN